MRVEILEGETVIGSAILVHLDPPMGVASGPFTPSAQYDRIRHANTVNGAYIDDFGKSLRVRADKGGELDASIAIEDWAEALGLRELTIFFADGNDYRALFSDHEEYKDYYPNNG